MKKLILTLIILNFLSLTIYSQSMWVSQEKEVSLFNSNKAHTVGDIVIILIEESSTATQSANTTTKTSDKISLSGQKGSGLLGFMPLFGLTNQSSNDFSGDGKTTRKGSITAKVAGKIMQDLGNGNYLVKGTKVLNINGEKEIISISGIVRGTDITGDNTIKSTNIYNIQVDYTGKGNIDDVRKPGILTKVINWIF